MAERSGCDMNTTHPVDPELRSQREEEQVAMAVDRLRIAIGLNELLLRRLYAASITLQSSVVSFTDRRFASRIEEVIDEIDTTINDIQTTIFAVLGYRVASGPQSLNDRR